MGKLFISTSLKKGFLVFDSKARIPKILQKVGSDTYFQWASLLLISLFLIFIGSETKELQGIYVYYADISRKIVETGEWLSLYAGDTLYVRKPPLAFWLSALSIKVFGPTSFAAVFPTQLFSVACIFSIAWLGNKLFDKITGWLAAFACLTTSLFLHNATNFRMDPALLFGVTLSVAGYLVLSPRLKPAIFFGGIGIATLAKGTVGLLPLLLAAIHKLFNRTSEPLRLNTCLEWLAWTILLLPTIGWYLHLAWLTESQIINALVADTLARSAEYSWSERLLRHYIGPLAKGYWPWLPFMLIGSGQAAFSISGYGNHSAKRSTSVLLVGWFLIVLLGASLKPSGYTRYLFLALPAMSILSARGIIRALRWKQIPWKLPIILVLTTVIASFVLVATPLSIHEDSREEINTMRYIVSHRLANHEKLLFLTTPRDAKGAKPLWSSSWSRYYLDRELEYIPPEDAQAQSRSQTIILLMRNKVFEKYADEITLTPLAKSQNFLLAETKHSPAE